MRRLVLGPVLVCALACAATGQSFVNWETPHVHPLDLTPDRSLLLAVNTAAARLELFDVAAGVPRLVGSVPVGLDPVSVRVRDEREAWVVNHVSDSVSIVDLPSRRVVATLDTDDEPADVVFAGDPQRAFVSCSQANSVLVFDPSDRSAAPVRVPLLGEDPRALAVAPDGKHVFVAVFESGNRSTILGGGQAVPAPFPPNVVSDPNGPHGGVNPPPNAGDTFRPPKAEDLPTPPRVGLVVKQQADGRWLDDSGADWTRWVSGRDAAASGRPEGWTLLDHDVAVIDAKTLRVAYADHAMNVNMALAVSPATGLVAVVGTDAHNEVRFEPNLTGTFLRVQLALVEPSGPRGPRVVSVVDLNPHLDYATPSVPQAQRERSIGDPRGIAWSADGSRAWIGGLGSNNVVVVDARGARLDTAPIEVGEGPTGLRIDGPRERLYVLNKLGASISVVDVKAGKEVARVPFHDPTPASVRSGRRHLYATHESSGLGMVACGSCHVDARFDRLAWDLGDPAGDVLPVAGRNLASNIPGMNPAFDDFHPMKGPMTTQTLQDIIGKEPHHWRGDRSGLEEFASAYVTLQGADAAPSAAEMQELEDFLATITFPPNPYRDFDNSLPTDLDLSRHRTSGRFAPAGQPMPNGNAQRGLVLYRPPNLLSRNVACVTCHTLPIGIGSDYTFEAMLDPLVPIAAGPSGERHHALIAEGGSTIVSTKVPQLRSQYEKVGFDLAGPASVMGFGFAHDGSIDSLPRFLSQMTFDVQSDQDIADLTALLLAFSGSGFPEGKAADYFEPPGTPSLDTHAAVGKQTTLVDADEAPPEQAELVAAMLALADSGAVGLVAHGVQDGLARGYAYAGDDRFRSDRAAETVTADELTRAAVPGAELTLTVVPAGTETRLALDRDEDGALDRDELDAGTNPADPASTPGPRSADEPVK